ncbi:hypothetical protein A2U01_0041421, partial [Trifolium medium]|nr:hypothetical protein [Trifolium medium]
MRWQSTGRDEDHLLFLKPQEHKRE